MEIAKPNMRLKKPMSKGGEKLETFCSDFSFCDWLHDDKVVERLFHDSRISSAASKIGFQKRLEET